MGSATNDDDAQIEMEEQKVSEPITAFENSSDETTRLLPLKQHHSFVTYLQKSSLLAKSPLFASTDLFRKHGEHVLLLREHHVSLERLNPHPECSTRKSSPTIAMFNLVATVCGGGVLSLPLAFSRAGIIPTTLLMMYGVLTTDFSLFLLVDCARRIGGRSYSDVALAAFGSSAQFVTTVTLATMLCGSLIAYQVLVKDIWSPLIFSLLPDLQTWAESVTGSQRKAEGFLLGCIMILALPLMVQRDLHALRHTCYVGFGSCVLLMVAVVFRAGQKLELPGAGGFQVNWWSSNPADWLFAFPIVVLCFFCSYNVLSVHSQLVQPTRERIRRILASSMLICFVLFYFVGLCGYLYAGAATADNILLNFSITDKAVLAGRMGFCLTLTFILPLIMLPCREAAVSIPAQYVAWRNDDSLVQKYQHLASERQHGAHFVVNGVDFDNSAPVLISNDFHERHGSKLKYGTLAREENLSADETLCTLPSDEEYSIEDEHKEKSTHDWKEKLTHVGSTIAISVATYLVAISVPGVATVWSICGSSMAIWIAFIVPTGCFLKIREHKGLTTEALGAWILLLISIVAMIVCTRQAIISAVGG